MDKELLQNLINRVESLEIQSNKDSFSAEDIYRKYINIANRFKIPVVATNPTIGSIGDIVCVVTTFKMCTVASTTAPTWTPLLSSTGDGSSLTGISTLKKIYTAGPALSAGDVVSVGPYQSDGGVTLDAKGTQNASKSFNITIGSNSNRILVVFVSAAGHGTGDTATYNGASMTRITSSVWGIIFYLVAPDTGTHTFTITSVDAAASFSCAWMSFYNAKQTGQPDASSCTDDSSQVSINTVLNGCMVLGGGVGGVVSSNADDYDYQTVGGIEMGDSGIVYPAGVSLNVDINDAASHPVPMLFSIAPATTVSEFVLIKASAANQNNQFYKSYNAVAGIVPSAVSAGASGSVVTSGVATGLSGLSASTKTYYLSDTAGAISTTAGTNTVKIGVNDSTTSLILKLS